MESNLYTTLDRIDGVFNIVGIFPVVNIASGAVRVKYGTIEAIVGMALTTLGIISFIFKDSHLLEVGTTHFVHGVANMARGVIDVIPIIGSIINIMIVINSKNRLFMPRANEGKRISYLILNNNSTP